jgi:hypothetical protein
MAKSQAKTAITVRVQARGGKFLGNDVGGSEVTLRDAQTGVLLASGVALGGSGNLQSTYAANASPLTIVTPGKPPTVQWLVPDAQTSRFRQELAIDRPTLVAIEVRGPLGGLQSQQTVRTAQWVVPGEDVDQGPGFVVELPGLVVQALQPATHLALASVPAEVPIAVNVTMMCGCPIAPGKPWLPGDFDVKAVVRKVGGSVLAEVKLKFQDPGPSLFSGSYQVTKKGYYQADIHAIQKSTGNTGIASVTFYYEPTT